MVWVWSSRVFRGPCAGLRRPRRGVAQAAPDLGSQMDARFINGMTTQAEKLVVLLDIDRVLGGEERAAVGSVK